MCNVQDLANNEKNRKHLIFLDVHMSVLIAFRRDLRNELGIGYP